MTLTRSNNTAVNGQRRRSAVVRVVGRGRQAEVVLDDTLPFPALEQGLRAYLSRNPAWFEGAKVTLNVGNRVLSIKDVTYIKEILEREFKLTIEGLWCGPEILETLISQNVSLPVKVAPDLDRSPNRSEPDWQETMLYKGTCRSGTTIHNNGNLVILGDVNPGAEVTAAGDIIVFGRLSGLAHAGVDGNIKAVVLAMPVDASRLRIGPYSRTEGADPGTRVSKLSTNLAALARVDGSQVIVEPYVTSSIWRRYN